MFEPDKEMIERLSEGDWPAWSELHVLQNPTHAVLVVAQRTERAVLYTCQDCDWWNQELL